MPRYWSSDEDIAVSVGGVTRSWEWVRSLVDKDGPRRTGTMNAQAAMIASLRHGNGSWLPRR